MGFGGSFPHFRRTRGRQIDLLTFQFSMFGGQFVVEIGKFPATGHMLAGKLIPPAEVRMRHLLDRKRLGSTEEIVDHWFEFDSGNYSGVAASVLPYLKGQAVQWWDAV
jgi:hypothetical protein